jgi:hypothetical protein
MFKADDADACTIHQNCSFLLNYFIVTCGAGAGGLM